MGMTEQDNSSTDRVQRVESSRHSEIRAVHAVPKRAVRISPPRQYQLQIL